MPRMPMIDPEAPIKGGGVAAVAERMRGSGGERGEIHRRATGKCCLLFSLQAPVSSTSCCKSALFSDPRLSFITCLASSTCLSPSTSHLLAPFSRLPIGTLLSSWTRYSNSFSTHIRTRYGPYRHGKEWLYPPGGGSSDAPSAREGFR